MLLATAFSSAYAQEHSAIKTKDEITALLDGQPLLLRGFWIEDKLEFDENGTPKKPYRTGSFTESAFKFGSAKLDGDKVTIEGSRVGLLFEKGAMQRVPLPKSQKDATPEKITIVIDGDKAGDFSRELDAIFATRIADIDSTLPDYWQKYMLKGLPHEDKTPGDPSEKPYHVAGNVKPPKLLHMANPKFSDAARRTKTSGTVEVYVICEPDGKPSHIVIAKPVGMGLDERAAEAVSQYKFQPATKDGKPVRVDLYIDVNFQIF